MPNATPRTEHACEPVVRTRMQARYDSALQEQRSFEYLQAALALEKEWWLLKVEHRVPVGDASLPIYSALGEHANALLKQYPIRPVTRAEEALTP